MGPGRRRLGRDVETDVGKGIWRLECLHDGHMFFVGGYCWLLHCEAWVRCFRCFEYPTSLSVE
jgi:hypothetical protein